MSINTSTRLAGGGWEAGSAAFRRPARVSVLGASLDVGNRGVRALGVSLAQLLTRTSAGIELVFHYGNAKGDSRWLANSGNDLEVKVRNCRMSPKSAPAEHILVILTLALLHRIGLRAPARRNPWLASLLAAAFVGDIRGGDSFSDVYGFRRFLLGSLPLLSVALLGRPYTMLPQTYGPFRLRMSRSLASFLLRRATTIVTRDRNCESTVRELCGRTPRFCPDVAFTMEPIKPKKLQFVPGDFGVDGDDLVVGVNVSGLLYTGGYTGRNMFGLRCEYRDLVDQLVERLLGSTGAKILLIPHVFGSEAEEEACSSLLQSAGRRHPGRVFTLAQPLSEREIKWVIGRTHFLIGSRMHACIAALSQCVPAMGLAYSDKFLGVFQSAGVADGILDLRKVEPSEVIGRALSALERRVELREQLKSRIPLIQEEIFETFRELLVEAQLR